MTTAYLGVDPGATGAIALYGDDCLDVVDYGPGAVQFIRDAVAAYSVNLCAIELVGAMPGQGVVSMFNFGKNFGWWLGIMDAIGIPYILVRPQKWCKDCQVPPKKDKADKPGLEVARRMFPMVELGRKKDHGRADALLLAWWASRQGV